MEIRHEPEPCARTRYERNVAFPKLTRTINGRPLMERYHYSVGRTCVSYGTFVVVVSIPGARAVFVAY